MESRSQSNESVKFYKKLPSSSGVPETHQRNSSNSMRMSGLFTQSIQSGNSRSSSIYSVRASRMVYAAHSGNPSVDQGSLSVLGDALRLERRFGGARKTQLSDKARNALQMSHACLIASMGHDIDPTILQVWEHHRKATTVNSYAHNFIAWHEYCKTKQKPSLPAEPYLFATWLAQMSLSDKTASPTDNRCASVSYFCKSAGMNSPVDSHVVKITKESIIRRLGYRKLPKAALTEVEVDRVVSHLLSQHDVDFQNIANAFRVALAYEATLRWDDFEDTQFGDFIITDEFVRVFLIDTKTDTSKQGQWATFAASPGPRSAYQLLRKLIGAIQSLPEGKYGDLKAHLPLIPMMFKKTEGPISSILVDKVSYNEFLKTLKDACKAVGLDPTIFGTHSMRRGNVTDNFAKGVPDQIIKHSGRWRSNAYQGYIDNGLLLQLQVYNTQHTRIES